MVRAALSAATAFVLALAIAHGQAPAAGSLTASGRILDAATGTPVAAVVTLAGRGTTRHVLTGGDGRFAFDRLDAGSYALSAARPGYFSAAWQQRQPAMPGLPVDLTTGGNRGDLDLRLWKQSAIAGRVMDGRNPVPGADVHSLRHSLVGGRWRDVPVAAAVADDQGRFRIDGLAPGRFALVAEPPPDRATLLLLSLLSANPSVAGDIINGMETSASGGLDVDASSRHFTLARTPPTQALSLAPGASIGGIDIAMSSVTGVRLSGIVTSDSPTFSTVQVELHQGSDDASDPAVATTSCTEDGRFEFSGVPEGSYIATALVVPPGSAADALPAMPTLWARESIDVRAADTRAMTIALHRGVMPSGRIAFDDGRAPDQELTSAIHLRLDPADRPSPPGAGEPIWRGVVRPDGRVEWMGVPPGRYFARVTGAPHGWTVQSAAIDGHDALDDPIDLTADRSGLVLSLSTKPAGSLGGTVHDSAAGRAADATVIVFPANVDDRQDTSTLSRRMKLTRPSAAGGYGVGGLPTGDYRVVAATGDLPADWQDPDLLASLTARATPARVEWGAHLSIDLDVVAIR